MQAFIHPCTTAVVVSYHTPITPHHDPPARLHSATKFLTTSLALPLRPALNPSNPPSLLAIPPTTAHIPGINASLTPGAHHRPRIVHSANSPSTAGEYVAAYPRAAASASVSPERFCACAPTAPPEGSVQAERMRERRCASFGERGCEDDVHWGRCGRDVKRGWRRLVRRGVRRCILPWRRRRDWGIVSRVCVVSAMRV